MEGKFSKNIRADEDAFYMSNPEISGNYLANKLSHYRIAVELCSAVGMTCICLAKKMDKVYGVELDKKRIEDAKYNAQLYGVDKKVEFICGNVLDENILKNIDAEVAILDPDWSGDKKRPQDHVFLLSDTMPNAIELINKVRENITNNIVIRLSKNFSLEAISEIGNCHVDNIIYEGRIRFKYAYFGDDIKEISEEDIILDKE